MRKQAWSEHSLNEWNCEVDCVEKTVLNRMQSDIFSFPDPAKTRSERDTVIN